MTRTSKALKRLGVAGLAAATIGAGVPALIASAAQAAGPVTTVTVNPTPSKTGAAGTCLNYSVRATDGTNGVPGATITVRISTPGNSTTQDVDFCTAAQAGYDGTTAAQPAPQAGTIVSNQGPQNPAAVSTDVARFVTDANGYFTFGVISNEANATASPITTFVDANSNGTFDAGELAGGGSSAIFGPGGTAGSNANQNAAAAVTVSPSPDKAVVGEPRTYTVKVYNNAGTQDSTTSMAGVTPTYTVAGAETQGPTNCPSTDNNGVSKCVITYTKASPPNDTVTFYVNKSTGSSAALEGPGEPSTTDTVTVNATPTQGAQTLSASCISGGTSNTLSTTSPCVNEVRDPSRTVRFVLENSSTSNTASTALTLLSFSISGGSSDATVSPTECQTADYTTVAGDTSTSTTNSFCDVVVNDPSAKSGEVITVTGTIRGTTTKASATVTFRNQPQDARNITLAPKTATTAPGTLRTYTATVVDSDGKPVQGVVVDFTESGPGAFRNGGSAQSATTDANGQATADVTSTSTESGTETITATISSTNPNYGVPQCTQAANTGTDPRSGTLSTTNKAVAGNCSDTATNTIASPSPSPSVSSTAPAGRKALSLVINTPTITAGQQATLTVTGEKNQGIQLECYTRPSIAYSASHATTINAAGDPVVYKLSLGRNTRCFAEYTTNPTQGPSTSQVISVKTAISIFPVRKGVRNYVFQGHNLPKYSGQLITLYYVNSAGDTVRKGNVKTDDTGIYYVPVQFLGTGTFTFYVRTGQTLNNAAGESAHVAVTIH